VNLLAPAALAALALVVPAGASAEPAVCHRAVLEAALVEGAELTVQRIAGGERVNLVRCGDVTDDGIKDALFAVASGGTAGNTRFGVIEGREDGSAGGLVLYKRGYKVGLARRNRRSFEVLQPHYAENDPNCCPSSFRQRRYTWTGAHFKAGKAKKVTKAPRRFYRP
jgi:hypothetical protein